MDSAVHTLVRNGAEGYAQALANAGGTQLDALMRQSSPTAVCAALYASPPYTLQVPPLPVLRLCVNLTRSRVSGGMNGERPRSYDARRYSMFLLPAGMAAVWHKDTPSRHLTLYFHAEVLDDGAAGAARFDKEQPVFNAQLAGIRPLADRLAAELSSANPWRVEAADSLARLLLVRFARRMRDLGSSPNLLPVELMARLRGYMLAHLSEPLPVADLAREAGLPTQRFARAFSEHAAQAPHQFVLTLRLNRACVLLRTSTLNLLEVARDCGFANPQHLCNAMRRRLGTTPSSYRRAFVQSASRDQPEEPAKPERLEEP